MRSRYKLGRAEYEEILLTQGGGCAICGITDPGKRRFHVDHDHECCPTEYSCCGQCIRGLLCISCNLMLGSAKDDPEVLLAGVEYLGRGVIARIVPAKHEKVNWKGGRIRRAASQDS